LELTDVLTPVEFALRILIVIGSLSCDQLIKKIEDWRGFDRSL
jgi:hypothetical protein